jgi:hypothetical protein
MAKQLIHLVIGGRLKETTGTEFENLDEVDVVGVYPNYKAAHDAWKNKAYATVDDALVRYFIVHLHRLMDPESEDGDGGQDL